MLNFKKTPLSHYIGPSIRYTIKFLFGDLVLPILRGPLHGSKWVVSCSNFAYWLGCYELEHQKFMLEVIKAGSTVLDIGANVGYHTILLSKIVGYKGKVFSFEPYAGSLYYLKRNVEINKCVNVVAINLAISDLDGTFSFFATTDAHKCHLSERGNISVRTTTLDNLREKGIIDKPDFIKMDIEGAEVKALNGAIKLLENDRPIILLSTHSNLLKKNCIEILKKVKYDTRIFGDSVSVCGYDLIAFPIKR